MLSDLQHACRQLRKHPFFAAIIIFVLAFGIGSNTAVTSVAYDLLLRHLPVERPDELALVGMTGAPNIPGRFELFSHPTFAALAGESRSLTSLAAVTSARLPMARNTAVAGTGELQVEEVSGDYFATLGVGATLGRTLLASDDRPGSLPVAVLSYGCWQSRFGGDRNVVGKRIVIGRVPFLVVGVARRRFSGVFSGRPADAWISLHSLPLLDPKNSRRLTNPHDLWLHLFGRLKPGVTLQSAAAEIDVLFQRELARQGILDSRFWRGIRRFGKIDLQPGGAGFSANAGHLAQSLGILFAITACVLLVAGANAASLFQARVAERRRELAIRMTLGLGRAGVVRHLLTETFMLAAAGAVLGIVSARWGSGVLLRYLRLPQSSMPIDLHVCLYLTLLTVAVALMVGFVPAIRLRDDDLSGSLRSDALTIAGGKTQRAAKFLVSVQIAMAVPLLVASSLFVRTLQELKDVDLGFSPRRLVSVTTGVDRRLSPGDRNTLALRIASKLRSLPGVANAALSTGGMLTRSAQMVVRTGPAAGRSSVHVAYAGPHYFETLGIRLVSGRPFVASDMVPTSTADERTASPVVIVNQAFARQFFPGRNPLGHAVTDAAGQAYRIIGVAPDTAYYDLRQPPYPEVFLPYSQLDPAAITSLSFQVRAIADPRSVIPAIRERLAEINPGYSRHIVRMQDILLNRLSTPRLVAKLAGLFSLFALTLSAAGLYGVLSSQVTRRTREIGVRMALGAGRGSIVRLVLKEGVAATAVGIIVGGCAAVFLSRMVRGFLYLPNGVDSHVAAVIIGPLLLVSVLACLLPTWSAIRIDPMTALRSE